MNEELIEDLEHLLGKLHAHWNNDLWVDATDLVAVEEAIELLRKAQEK